MRLNHKESVTPHMGCKYGQRGVKKIMHVDPESHIPTISGQVIVQLSDLRDISDMCLWRVLYIWAPRFSHPTADGT